ncbi:MAG: hypothetical protein AB202_00665 [Parcubacteria bacterium C7867-007]|nr:MAG: hypothetical protein AB202_00665 [Parcubacteria bacterium C7867-007]
MGQLEPWHILLLAALLSIPVHVAIRRREPISLPEPIPYEVAEVVQARLFEILPLQLTKWGGLRLDDHGWVIVVQYEDPADLAHIPAQRNGVQIIPQQIAV